MDIIVAVENSVAFPFKPGIKPGLLGEHGLALIVDRPDGKWLYDTGRGLALLPNLKTLGFSPDDFQGVVLSHAHLDHFGSLMAFLQNRTRRVDLFIHPGAFVKRYTRIGDNYRSVGLPWSREELTAAGANIHETANPVEIAPGMWITGEIQRKNQVELVAEKFFVDCPNGERIHDEIVDDQALILDTERGLVVLTGCAHAGVCNILERARELFPGKRLRAVLGGLHLEDASPERMEYTLRYLEAAKMETVAVGHCTGFDACCMLREELPKSFVPLQTGKVFRFNGETTEG